jgi:surface polysaccharide O-acyltransferase-like enzyme
MLDKESSLRLSILRFPLIVGVIFIHNAESIVQFAKGTSEGASSVNLFNEFVRNLISNGIATTAVPLFFLMSGYFFFRGFHSFRHDYIRKINSRVHTLLIPFLIWNILTLIVFAVVQSLPATQSYLSGRNSLIAMFNVYDYIEAIFGINRLPIAYQFWFIRDLMVLALLAPVINFFINRRLQLYYISLITACWLTGVWPIHVPSAEAALFFSIGSTVAYNKKSMFELDDYCRPVVIAYLVLLVADILSKGTELGLYLHRIGVIMGVASALCLTKSAVLHVNLKESLLNLSGISFFIYAAHEPLLMTVRKIAYKLIQPNSSFSNLALYFLIPISVIILLVAVYRICERNFPNATRILTGGR